MQCGSIYFRLISWFWGEWNVFSFSTAVNRGLTIIITTLPSQIQTRLLHFEKTFFCSSMKNWISTGLEVQPNFKFLINMFRPQNHPCTAADFSNTGRGIMATEGLWSKNLNQTSPNRLRLQDSFLIFTIRTRPKTNLIDDRKFLFAHLYKLVWTGLDYKLDEVHKTKNEFLYLISLI